MEIKEALKMLDQVCAEFKGTRQEHIMLQQAVQTVRATATLKPDKKDEPKREPDGNTK